MDNIAVLRSRLMVKNGAVLFTLCGETNATFWIFHSALPLHFHGSAHKTVPWTHTPYKSRLFTGAFRFIICASGWFLESGPPYYPSLRNTVFPRY